MIEAYALILGIVPKVRLKEGFELREGHGFVHQKWKDAPGVGVRVEEGEVDEWGIKEG